MAEVGFQIRICLWQNLVFQIDLRIADKNYIIHQTLAFGTLEEIKFLFNIYSAKEIHQIFLKRLQPLYSPQGLNFIQNYILQIKDIGFPKEYYIKNVFGSNIRT